MLKFYMDNQKMIHKVLLNQVAISALGLMVGFPVNALAYNFALGEIPNLLAGIFTAAMYFFVLYDAFWEWGSKYIGRKGENVPTAKQAFLSAVFAYIPTLFFVFVYAVSFVARLSIIAPFKWILLLLCNGMHFGSMNFLLAYVPQSYSDGIQLIIFIVASLLAMLVCALGFKVGKSGKTMFAGYFHKKPDKEQY